MTVHITLARLTIALIGISGDLTAILALECWNSVGVAWYREAIVSQGVESVGSLDSVVLLFKLRVIDLGGHSARAESSIEDSMALLVAI